MEKIALTLAAGLPILAAVILFFFFKKRKKSSIMRSSAHLTEKQRTAIERHNNLFENVPLHNGEEWKTLSVKELTQVCLQSVDAVFMMHHGRYSLPVVIEDTIGRCENLSQWMERMQYNSFYMGSDMSYLIQKPAAVAAALRQHIASLLETTVNAA